MRMWMVNPKILCNKHLLGEHVEIHMFVGTIRKCISISGYIENGLVETDSIVSRHAALVEEMAARGMKHSSPIAEMDVEQIEKYLTERGCVGHVDADDNLYALAYRCKKCRDNIEAML